MSVSKVKVKVEQKVKFTWLAITPHLIVTETSNLVHILVWKGVPNITLTLKISPKVRIFETYKLKGEGESQQNVKFTKINFELKNVVRN